MLYCSKLLSQELLHSHSICILGTQKCGPKAQQSLSNMHLASRCHSFKAVSRTEPKAQTVHPRPAGAVKQGTNHQFTRKRDGSWEREPQRNQYLMVKSK